MTSTIEPEELAYTAAPEDLAGYLAGVDRPTDTPGPVQSVRTARQDEHDITVTTVYEVVVDGSPVAIRLTVDDGGMLHCPGLPYQRFTSALDAVRALIAAYPDHFGGGA
ncbi:hypothetical protein [Streptomyces sp. NPDC001070]